MTISLAEEMDANPSDPATINPVAITTDLRLLIFNMLYLSHLIADFL
jgi:hypothetical protein